MVTLVLSFWAGVLVVAVWPDASERAELARWVRNRATTISRARNDGHHYDHPPHTLSEWGYATCRKCDRLFDLLDGPDADEWHHGHDCEPPRDGIARTTPEGSPNVWADLEHPDREQ